MCRVLDGQCSRIPLLGMSVPHSLYDRFPNGALVTVAVVHWQPYINVGADGDGCQVVSGPMGGMLAVLAHALNFT